MRFLLGLRKERCYRSVLHFEVGKPLEAHAFEQFEIRDTVSIAPGVNGFPKVVVRHDSGHSLEAYLYGGHVTSWKTPQKEELLFLSSRAEFVRGKAIRGGIPIVFPQFGPGELPSHGIARICPWRLTDSKILENKDVSITLEMDESCHGGLLWPYSFLVELNIVLGSRLGMTMRVVNKDDELISFQNAFHTYFNIGNIDDVRIRGLSGLSYVDQVRNRQRMIEEDDDVSLRGEVDRVYMNAPDQLTIVDAGRRTFHIRKNYLNDAVLWNPGKERGAAIKDLEEDGYQRMVCLETANVLTTITLGPGDDYLCSQELSYE